MKIVFDTNVWISATMWDDSEASKLMDRLLRLKIPIFVSKDIIDEYSEILLRDFNYNKEQIQAIVEDMTAYATFVDVIYYMKVVDEDPDDDLILNCAFSCYADYLVSYDKHILNLKEFGTVKMIKPSELSSILNTYEDLFQ